MTGYPGRFDVGVVFKVRHRLAKGALFGIHCRPTRFHVTNSMAGLAPIGRHSKATILALVFGFRSLMFVHIDTDRKSTRLNSSHVRISYAVFCLKKKKKHITKHMSREQS